jgi:hypothetical protein
MRERYFKEQMISLRLSDKSAAGIEMDFIVPVTAASFDSTPLSASSTRTA